MPCPFPIDQTTSTAIPLFGPMALLALVALAFLLSMIKAYIVQRGRSSHRFCLMAGICRFALGSGWQRQSSTPPSRHSVVPSLAQGDPSSVVDTEQDHFALQQPPQEPPSVVVRVAADLATPKGKEPHDRRGRLYSNTSRGALEHKTHSRAATLPTSHREPRDLPPALRQPEGRSFSGCSSALWRVIFVVFCPVVSTGMSLVVCQTVDDEEILAINPGVECWTASHWLLLALLGSLSGTPCVPLPVVRAVRPRRVRRWHAHFGGWERGARKRQRDRERSCYPSVWLQVSFLQIFSLVQLEP